MKNMDLACSKDAEAVAAFGHKRLRMTVEFVEKPKPLPSLPPSLPPSSKKT